MVAPSSIHWHPSHAYVVDALVPDRSRSAEPENKLSINLVCFVALLVSMCTCLFGGTSPHPAGRTVWKNRVQA